jgi:hypothetical protein
MGAGEDLEIWKKSLEKAIPERKRGGGLFHKDSEGTEKDKGSSSSSSSSEDG